MEGGQSRDFVMLRMALAVVCAVLMALVAAPLALAGAPASDQYGSALPGVGGGGGSGSPSGSSSGGSGGEATIPVAGDTSPSSGDQGTGGEVSPSGTGAKSSGAGSGSGSEGSSHRDGDQLNKASKDTRHGQSAVDTKNASHSVPQIAADSAGDSWLPFFIGGMVALACAAAALIYRNRRRTAQS
jgi:hypothetical protein